MSDPGIHRLRRRKRSWASSLVELARQAPGRWKRVTSKQTGPDPTRRKEKKKSCEGYRTHDDDDLECFSTAAVGCWARQSKSASPSSASVCASMPVAAVLQGEIPLLHLLLIYHACFLPYCWSCSLLLLLVLSFSLYLAFSSKTSRASAAALFFFAIHTTYFRSPLVHDLSLSLSLSLSGFIRNLENLAFSGSSLSPTRIPWFANGQKYPSKPSESSFPATSRSFKASKQSKNTPFSNAFFQNRSNSFTPALPPSFLAPSLRLQKKNPIKISKSRQN